MEKNKIIQILCHSLDNDISLYHHVYRGWPARTLRDINIKTKKYILEAWYPVRNLKQINTFIKDYIVYRLFPAYSLNPILDSFFPTVRSPLLYKELKKQDAKKTIVSFQGERGLLIHKALNELPNLKYTIQYHGYGQPGWLEWIEKLLISPLERKNFKYVSHFFVHIQKRIDYLKNNIQIDKQKIDYHQVGVDFQKFKPRNKKNARKKLHIPLDAFIMLYVGKLIKSKGVDKILKVYQILKKKYQHLYLIFIGIDKTDPLYSLSKRIADKILGNLPNDQLPLYYNAADVYCFFGTNKTRLYAGPGTATMEALASDINVVSTNNVHFPDTIVKKIGLIPKSFNDFLNNIEFLIKNPLYQIKPRKIVTPYVSFEYTTTNLIKTYDKLLSEKE